MRSGGVCAAGLVVIVWVAGCGPRQGARVQDGDATARQAERVTAEDVIREHDLERLWSLEEYAAEQHALDAEVALLDGEIADDADYRADAEERAGGTMEHVGRATWSVLVVAFTLGMAALPFLV
jgi:hypothetical protein